MIAGLIGMLAALIVFVLIALLSGRRIDPKIAGPFNLFLTEIGFAPIRSSDPIYKKIRDALRLTQYLGYVEQIYRRAQDDCVLVWTLDSEDTNHRVIALIAQTPPSAPWVLCLFPGLTGSLRNIVRKTFALSLSGSGFRRIEMADLGSLNQQADLYAQGNNALPSFSKGFTDRLQQCGNIVLRSDGSLVLLERIALGTERLEQGTRELLRLRDLLAADP